MQVALQVPARIWRRISAYVLQDDIERHAFIYCRRSGNLLNVRLHGVDFRLPSDADYDNASAVDVVLKRDYVIQCLEKARRSEQSIVDIHSHPLEGEAHFSNVDYRFGSEAADWVTRKISEGVFPDIFWAMIVVGQRSVEGLVWNHELRKFEEFSEIVIEGTREGRKPEQEVAKKSWVEPFKPKIYLEERMRPTYKETGHVLVSVGRILLYRISADFHPGAVRLFGLTVHESLPHEVLSQREGVRVILADRKSSKSFYPFGFVTSEIKFDNRALGCGVGFHAGCECGLPVVAESVRKRFCVIDLRRYLGWRQVRANVIVKAAMRYFDTIANGTGGFEWVM